MTELVQIENSSTTGVSATYITESRENIYKYQPWNNSSSSMSYYSNPTFAKKALYRAGVQTENWRQKMQSGEIIHTPYVVQELNGLDCSVALDYVSRDDVSSPGAGWENRLLWTVTGTLSVPPPVLSSSDSPDIDDLRTLSSTSAHADMVQSAAQTLVTALEFKKTLGLLEQTSKSLIITLAKANRDLRKSPRAVKSMLKEVKVARNVDAGLSKWLEYRYGWMPLLYDIEDHQKALVNLVRGQLEIYRARGYAFNDTGAGAWSTYDTSVGLANVEGYSGLNLYVRGRIRDVIVDDWAIATLHYKIAEGATAEFIHELGLTGFLSAGYEVVPYSFVADWFTNIGDYAAALDSMYSPIISEARGSTASKYRLVKEYELQNLYGDVGYNSHLQTLSGSAISQACRFSRTDLDHGENIGITSDVDMNWKRWLDATALLSNITGILRNSSDVAMKRHNLRI